MLASLSEEVIFLEDATGAIFPFLWEDGRLDFLFHRRYEVEANYDRLIAQYRRELEGIRGDLRRSPNDQGLHQLEMLYRQRIADAQQKRTAQVQSLRDEESAHQLKIRELERHHEPTTSSYAPESYGRHFAFA